MNKIIKTVSAFRARINASEKGSTILRYVQIMSFPPFLVTPGVIVFEELLGTVSLAIEM